MEKQINLNIIDKDNFNKFNRLYSDFLIRNNKDKNIIPSGEKMSYYSLDFIIGGQMGIWTTQQNGVYFHNIYEVIFKNLREYLEKYNMMEYKLIDWSQTAYSIIETLEKDK